MADTTFVIIPGRDGVQKSAFPAGNAPISIGGSGALTAQAAAVAGVATGSAGSDTFPHANALFADGFESQALANVSGRNWTPDRNTTGFTWGGTNFTSLGTAAARVYGASGVINDPISNWPGADWTPFAGTTSLLFYYAAGANQSEQRFFVGQHLSDFWMRYAWRVPPNYSHGSAGGSNNKFLAIWTNTYDTSGDITFQLRPRDGGGGSKLVVQDGGVAQAEDDVYNDFVLTPSDRGRWMEFCVRAIPATGAGANNGTIQVWRRWQGDSAWTQIYNKTTARFQDGGQGIHEGYIMGWANGTYTETTWVQVDNVQIGSSSLVA